MKLRSVVVVMSAALVWGGTRLGFATLHFILASVVLVVVWLAVVVLLGRLYATRDTKERTDAAPAGDLFLVTPRACLESVRAS